MIDDCLIIMICDINAHLICIHQETGYKEYLTGGSWMSQKITDIVLVVLNDGVIKNMITRNQFLMMLSIMENSLKMGDQYNEI